VNKDVRSLGLSQESIGVLCLSNGELPLQAIAQALMMPEARIARIMAHLLELRLIEIVNTALETELQQDLSNIIIRCQYTLAQQRGSESPSQHLLGLITTLAECINGLLVHHGTYARSLRGRGQLPSQEIVRYLERRFAQPLQSLAMKHYAILETTNFAQGQLDCEPILSLNKVVKGDQLEEFYWEAVQGLAAFLRLIFAELVRDEVGNSHTGRQLQVAWKVFLSEIEHEVQHYQVYRAQRNTQIARGRDMMQSAPLGIVQSGNGVVESGANAFWSPETRRRSI
jgi:hypothetical protein